MSAAPGRHVPPWPLGGATATCPWRPRPGEPHPPSVTTIQALRAPPTTQVHCPREHEQIAPPHDATPGGCERHHARRDRTARGRTCTAPSCHWRHTCPVPTKVRATLPGDTCPEHPERPQDGDADTRAGGAEGAEASSTREMLITVGPCAGQELGTKRAPDHPPKWAFSPVITGAYVLP